jgi:FKBP-type peptidyl-prolyl cis-trans isomerase (trigger factor)
MRLEVKKIDATRRELKFEIPKDRVSLVLEGIYNDIGKVAKVRGYRPGKAPRHIVESEHSRLAQEEMLKKIIPEVYQEALEKENLKPLDYPEINDVSFKDGKVSFTAVLDIRPEVKLKNYKGIKVQRKSSQVTDEELVKTMEFFKKGQGGDTPVPLDDNFAKGLGYPTLEDFKTFLRRQMEMDKDRQNRGDVENQVIETLLKESSLVVPASAVQKQLEHLWEENVRHLKSRRMPEEEIKKKEEEMRKNLKPMAERDVKVFLVLEKIAELENITVQGQESLPHKVLEFLMKNANWEDAK